MQRLIFILLGPLLFLLCQQFSAQGLTDDAVTVFAVMLWMVVWWISEVVPLPVTALLPMLLFPLVGVTSAEAATSAYAHPIIFLFFAGFCLSIAMENTGLHRNVASAVLKRVGSSASKQLFAIAAVTAFLSMWMSNTATAVMMLPVALSIAASANLRQQSQVMPAFLLAVAYGASIGGVATLIGTPPNALLAAFLAKNYQIELGFAQWMILGVPLAISMLVFTWFWLSRVQFKLMGIALEATPLEHQIASHGSLNSAQNPATTPHKNRQRWVAVVFIVTALSWIFQPLLKSFTGFALTDTVIGLSAVLLLFVVRVHGDTVIRWQDTDRLPWGILLLFGGGLSLAGQIQQSGLAEYLAGLFSQLQGWSPWLIMLAVTMLVIFLTEVSSNTAVAAAFLPLLGPVALSLNLSPLYLTVPAALAASFAFMLPVATPPNAIVFASGQLTVQQMARVGFVLNLVGIVLICLLSTLLLPYLSHQ